jgi:NTP pyrophosphatase (non-canonical NTP hydrolase)
MTLNELLITIAKIETDKGWDKTHDIPGLFMFLSEEVGEYAKEARKILKAHFNNAGEETILKLTRQAEDELADVILNVLMIANRLNLDMNGVYRKIQEISSRDQD